MRLFIVFLLTVTRAQTPLEYVASEMCEKRTFRGDSDLIKMLNSNAKLDGVARSRLHLSWESNLALIALASHVIDNMSTNVAQEFLKSIRIRSLLTQQQTQLKMDILAAFAGPSAWVASKVLGPVQVCKAQLMYAPLWNLGRIAPEILSVPDIAQIVYHHAALRAVIASTANTKSKTFTSRNILTHLPNLGAAELLKVRVEGMTTSQWVREVALVILSPPSVFQYRQGQNFLVVDANDSRTSATGKDELSFQLGRLFGLMYVYRARLDGIVFEWDFYQVLTGHNDLLHRGSVTYGRMRDGFMSIVPSKGRPSAERMIHMISKLPGSYSTEFF